MINCLNTFVSHCMHNVYYIGIEWFDIILFILFWRLSWIKMKLHCEFQ